jgi:hypothetical protein
MSLKVVSNRAAPITRIFIKQSTSLQKVKVNGESITREDEGDPWFGIECYSLPRQGVRIDVQVEGKGQIEGVLIDTSYGLPLKLLSSRKGRPEHFASNRDPLSDTTRRE